MIRTGKAGKGTYGIVYNGETIGKEKSKVAVKRNIIDPSVSFSGSIKELDLLNRLKGHPYIVNLLSISYNNPFTVPNSPISRFGNYNLKEDYLHFIFEQADNNGHDLIYGGVHIGYLKLAMVQMLLSVEYMHSKKVIHRDIKPANLLWFVDKDNNPSIKICDFGLAKVYTRQGPMTPRVVTSWYRAPEICTRDPNYTYASDIWSIGCIMFEMVAKRALLQGSEDDDVKLLSRIIGLLPDTPYEDIKKMTKDHSITLTSEASPRTKHSIRELIGISQDGIDKFNEYPGNGSATYDQFIDLIKNILVLDPEKRYTIKQILAHEFFEPYRNIINDIRFKYPPIRSEYPKIKIIPCVERSWACKVAFVMFNARNSKNIAPWYRHRIIFQSIDMFDRYLSYLHDNTDITNKIESKYQGKYMTRYKTELRYLVCLYMSIKYFLTLQTPISFTILAADNYKTEQAMIEAEEFEKILLKDIFKMNIYRDTIYETLDKLPTKPNEKQIRNLLLEYGTIKDDINEVTVVELYNSLVLKMTNGKCEK
jgi:serine/threonine protein kinase